MNPVFEINPEHQEATLTNLFCEISEDSLTYFFQNEEDKKIDGLSHYELPDRYNNGVFSIKDILDEKQLLRKNYNKATIVYSFPEFALSPFSMCAESEKSTVIESMFGVESEKLILSDSLTALEINNFYRVPLPIHYYITSHFPIARFSHEVSNLILNSIEGTYLEVVFHQRKMVCGLFDEGKLQVANSFYFTASEDVIYHMLNVCKQFGMTSSIPVYIEGMVDIDSALAKEIRKFFSDVQYKSHQAKLAESMLHFPQHYFSHLFSLI